MQIAPFGLPIRPDLKYGGIERSILNLDREFTEQGHKSYVIATENSLVSGTLCPTLHVNTFVLKKSAGGGQRYENIATDEDYKSHCSKILEYILQIKPDVINDHFYAHPDFIRSKSFQKNNNLPPILKTLHGPLNPNNKEKFVELREHAKGKNVYFCVLSESQKEDFDEIPMPVDYAAGNGIDIGSFPFQDKGEGYVFSLGVICDYKGQDIALDIAKKLKKKIIVAGPIHSFVPSMKKYWEEEIKPRLERIVDEDIIPEDIGSFVEEFMSSKYGSVYIGELSDAQKKEFYKKADAFYFPGSAKEAFPGVLIESMVCGTPVVAYNKGAVSEIVKDGVTGYVIKSGDFNKFFKAALSINKISGRDCRNHVERNFSIQKQAANLLKVYEDVILRSSELVLN